MTTPRDDLATLRETLRFIEAQTSPGVTFPDALASLSRLEAELARLRVDSAMAHKAAEIHSDKAEAAEALAARYEQGLRRIADWKARNGLGYEGPRDVARSLLADNQDTNQ